MPFKNAHNRQKTAACAFL